MLVVDDNRTNRELLAMQLETWGLRYDSAADATQALALLREAADAGDPFDLALLDRMMPDVDGLQLAALIRAESDIAATRLLILSSVSGDVDDDDFRSAGERRALHCVQPDAPCADDDGSRT